MEEEGLLDRVSDRRKALDIPPSFLERFGLRFLSLFPRSNGAHAPFSLTDEELSVHVSWIMSQGLFLTSIVSILDVLPVVCLELQLKSATKLSSLMISLSTAGLTVALLPGELFFLFCISLYCAAALARFIDMNKHDMLGIFDTDRLLSRAALELDDPRVVLERVDAFKSISRWNLLLLGLLYKLKIVLSNVVLKFVFGLIFGDEFPIYLVSFFTEVFWNCVVLYKVQCRFISFLF